MTSVLGYQLLKAGTSIGADYREANRAVSRNDFINKIGIVEIAYRLWLVADRFWSIAVGNMRWAISHRPYATPMELRRSSIGAISHMPSAISQTRLYLRRQASSIPRYVLEQALIALLGWVPTVLGIALRAVFYRLMMHICGLVAIEDGVRLRFAGRIRLGHGVYLDHGVYLHACPNGIEIGDNTLVMHHAELHVYNFRDIPHSGITVGRNSLIGEFNVIRGQGGVTIGDRVYTSPFVQIVAVDHVYDDPSRPFVEQGITAQGIVIEDDVWIGAGAIITDGVHIGRGAVVGAGAVVTQDVAPHTVVAGVPARVVRDLRSEAGRKRELEVYY